MSDKAPLFPFPPAPSENQDPEPVQTGVLPPFPTFGADSPTVAGPSTGTTALPFSPDEVRDLKQVVSLFRSGSLGSAVVQPPVLPPVVAPPPVFAPPSPAQKISEPAAEGDSKKLILDFFTALPGCNQQENETKNLLSLHLRTITETSVLMDVTAHLAGVFPLRECLRHGTPEQKLFTLIALGDRFLQGMTGLVFPQRQALLKAVGTYLSDVSESTTFLTMEGDQFNTQYHERIPGASTSGRIVREMRGYLIIRKGTNQVIRLGRVWT